jgi:hypothetical protein
MIDRPSSSVVTAQGHAYTRLKRALQKRMSALMIRTAADEIPRPIPLDGLLGAGVGKAEAIRRAPSASRYSLCVNPQSQRPCQTAADAPPHELGALLRPITRSCIVACDARSHALSEHAGLEAGSMM